MAAERKLRNQRGKTEKTVLALVSVWQFSPWRSRPSFTIFSKMKSHNVGTLSLMARKARHGTIFSIILRFLWSHVLTVYFVKRAYFLLTYVFPRKQNFTFTFTATISEKNNLVHHNFLYLLPYYEHLLCSSVGSALSHDRKVRDLNPGPHMCVLLKCPWVRHCTHLTFTSPIALRTWGSFSGTLYKIQMHLPFGQCAMNLPSPQLELGSAACLWSPGYNLCLWLSGSVMMF